MERHPFLTVVLAEVVTAAAVVVGWNAWQHYRDNGVRLRDLVRL
jgi:hypothetical protein